MASTHAIAATSKGILRLLEQSYEENAFGGLAASFELYQAKDFQKPMKTGISLFLYHLTTNTASRNSRPRLDREGNLVLPPLPIDLHYLLTAWATDPGDQQTLLGWAMRTIQDSPILPSNLLNVGAPNVMEPGEMVELHAEQLSRQDLAPLWELMKPNQQPSAAYVARMVSLESRVIVDEHAMVQTRVFEMRKPVEMP